MASDIKTLEDLQRVPNSSLYELAGSFFIEGRTIGIYKFVLTERHNGRPWLVSYDIFNGDRSKVDIICSGNGIINPFSMQAGDEIFYPEPSSAESTRSTESSIKAIIANLKGLNAGKSKKTDTNRIADNSTKAQREKAKRAQSITTENNLLAANLTESNQNIQYSEGIIVLKPNF